MESIKKFLRPDWRKISLFILIFLFFPVPDAICAEPFGCSPAPFVLPLMFIVSLLPIVFLQFDFHSSSEFNTFLFGLLSPLLIYLVSCILISAWDKIRNKKIKT